MTIKYVICVDPILQEAFLLALRTFKIIVKPLEMSDLKKTVWIITKQDPKCLMLMKVHIEYS